jgi:hypothetical protein
MPTLCEGRVLICHDPQMRATQVTSPLLAVSKPRFILANRRRVNWAARTPAGRDRESL